MEQKPSLDALLNITAKEAEQAVREVATICPRPLQVDLWLFDLESGVRVTCDVGYFCAKFSLPRPDVHDRQTSDAHHRLIPPTLGAVGIIKHYYYYIIEIVHEVHLTN